jgi:hypothetical protein
LSDDTGEDDSESLDLFIFDDFGLLCATWEYQKLIAVFDEQVLVEGDFREREFFLQFVIGEDWLFVYLFLYFIALRHGSQVRLVKLVFREFFDYI